jgi:hypothetical protein
VLYVDDKFPRHPKVFRAGEKLGKDGAAQAIALFLEGLSYAREHLTDGFLPDKFVTTSATCSRPVRVAFVLSSRDVRLWHRVRGGYQIHDYHDWNRKASEVKEKREAERLKKQRQREAHRKGHDEASLAVSPRDIEGDSCARGTTYHVPRTTGPQLVPTVLQRKITAADAAARVQISTSFAQLCILAHYAADGLGDPAQPGEVAEEVKWACAAAHFDNPNPDDLTAAIDAVLTARAKGYRTPRERKAAS